ncbi:hypothetical protein PGTUg99_003010 [Puccinia graminis f. sp. tritici]|uniref:Uncharacterized protein n=1 Tax=Puccinia graminis f. sp. tritici TaxID=56615 RepID=A0A5B0RSA9_PUCGR|nr:hypothetical protein PGTUg99_003010 [Puccinia graminis f. sp. tritici]
MVADNPPQISAIRWRIPASGCGFGCGCTLPPEILAGIRVSLGIPGAKRPHRREESLLASWFLNQLVGRGSSRQAGLCRRLPGGTTPSELACRRSPGGVPPDVSIISPCLI